MYEWIAYLYDIPQNFLHVYGIYSDKQEAETVAKSKQEDIDKYFRGEMNVGIAKVPRKER